MAKSKLRPGDVVSATEAILVLAADFTVTSTPADGISLALPSAGSWVIEISTGLEVATLGANRDLTTNFNVTNLTSISLAVLQLKTSSSPLVPSTQTANGGGHVVNLSSNNRVRILATGRAVVSAAAVITMQLGMAADTALLKQGSFIRARKYA